MPTYSPAELVAVIILASVTVVAAVWDTRFRKIPNQITVPLFLAGVIWQLAVNGWSGLGNVGAGLAIGFLPMFLLWITGSAGGGDAKLMGAVSVWLGFRYSLMVLAISVVCVLLVSIVRITWSFVTKGASKTRKEFLGDRTRRRGPDPKTGKLPGTMMTFATPIAVAVWAVLLLMGLSNTRAIAKTKQPPAGSTTTQKADVVKSNGADS